MKRDAVTIAIVVICIAALIYFVYGTFKLMGKDTPTNTVTESVTTLEDSEPDDYQFDDEGEITDDSTTIIDDDLDDDQLAEDYDAELAEDASDYDEEVSLTTNDDEEEDFSSASVGDYLVIAGAFKQMQNAENHARRIQALSCCSDAEVTLFNRGALAAVLVDRFDDKSDAIRLVEELKSDHDIDAYVHEKR